MLLRASKLASLLLILTFFMLLSTPVLALGLGVTPAKLDFSVSPGGTQRQTLNVINQSDTEAQFQVYVEGEYEAWLVIKPDEFELAPYQIEEVEIKVKPPFNATGKHQCSVCVVSLSPEAGLRIGTGIKVPVQINLKGLPVVMGWVPIMVVVLSGIAVIVILISGILIWRRRRKAD